MTDGDAVVRKIVKSKYDDGYAESVILREDQVIVSRETLQALVRAAAVTQARWGGLERELAEAREALK